MRRRRSLMNHKSLGWVYPVALALCLASWGVGWNLPSKERLELVLPPGLNSPQFRRQLQSSWQSMRERLGITPMLAPDAFSYGYHALAEAPAGWKKPPPILINPIRSFYLRSGHWDEPNILYAISLLRPWRLRFNPGIYYYGGGYLYPLAAWIACAAVVTPARLTPSLYFYLEDPSRMAWIYFLGRTFSVAAYLFGAALLFKIGRRYFGWPAGLWAAFFFVLSPGILIQAYHMKPHLLAALFVLLGFFFCLRVLEAGERNHYLLAGAAFGLAAGSAINQGIAAVILPIAMAMRAGGGQAGFRKESKYLLLSSLAGLLVFLAVNPYFLTQPVHSFMAMRGVARLSAPNLGKVWIFLKGLFPKGVTWPVYGLVLAAWASAWRSPNALERLGAYALALLILASFDFQNLEPLVSFQYFSGGPIAMLLAGQWVHNRRLWKPWGLPLVSLGAGLALAWSLWVCLAIAHNYHLDATDRSNHHLAGAWIQENLKPGSEIGIVGTAQPLNMPYFRLDRYRFKFLDPSFVPRLPARRLPQYLITAYPGYDEAARFRPTLQTQYRLMQKFPVRKLFGLGPEPAELPANPQFEIYEKISPELRKERNRSTAAPPYSTIALQKSSKYSARFFPTRMRLGLGFKS